MDLRRLDFLVRIIDAGSFTRAAESLHIAQPALSQHIHCLERSVGAPLLLRRKDGVVPTEAGWIAYRNAKLMARQAERTRDEIRMLDRRPGGRVAVGIAPHSHARRLVQPLLRAARARHPEILLHIRENFEGVLAEDLRLNRVDMAFFYEVVERPEFSYRAIAAEALYVVGTPELLEAAGDPACWHAGTPMVLPSGVHALRQLVDAIYARSRVAPQIVAEIESFGTLTEAVRAGLGATVLPRSVAAILGEDQGLCIVPFGPVPAFVTLSLCTTASDAPSDAAKAVQALVIELAGDLDHLQDVPPAVTIGASDPRRRRDIGDRSTLGPSSTVAHQVV